MTRNGTGDRGRAVTLLGIVLALHLLFQTVHGVPHVAIPIVLSTGLLALVALFVFALPVAGVALVRRGRDRLGVAVFTGSMAVSLVLVGVLHFVVPNPDHVASVPAGTWRLPFQVTAAALVVPDVVGVALGAWLWRRLDAAPSGDPPKSARVTGVPDAGFRPLARLTYWLSRRVVGEVPEPLAVTAHHGKLLAGTNAFEAALEGANRVDEGLKELVTVKTAMLVGCAFCIDIGSALAADHGVTEAQLRDLRDFEASDEFAARERVALRYAVAMTTTPASVSEELFESLAAEFDEAQLVELTAAIAFENYRARFNHAFGIDPQGFAEGGYCPRPEASTVEDATPPRSSID